MDLDKLAFPTKPYTFETSYAFPEDITVLSLDDIGRLMSKLGAYRGYVSSNRGIAEFKRRILEEKLKIATIEAKVRINDKTLTATALKESAKIDSNVTQIRNEMLEYEKQTIIYGALVEVYTGQIEILSREMYRRKMLNESE